MQLIPTAAERAKIEILKLIDRGPIPTATLMGKMNAKGHAKNTVERAKRELKRDGIITITRPGAKANPYFVALVG